MGLSRSGDRRTEGWLFEGAARQLLIDATTGSRVRRAHRQWARHHGRESVCVKAMTDVRGLGRVWCTRYVTGPLRQRGRRDYRIPVVEFWNQRLGHGKHQPGDSGNAEPEPKGAA